MTREKFEEIVEEGIEAIPKGFLEKLKNVDICIEEEPTPYQLEKLSSFVKTTEDKRAKKDSSCHPKPRRRMMVFGLYEGVPQTERWHYGRVLPDKITIFKKPIEKVARSEEQIKEIVRNTVWHEIAHHFGMDEGRVRAAEIKRKKKR